MYLTANFNSRQYIQTLAVTALIYALAGNISLWLAVPPGYATPVFPPAGIAMGLMILTRGRILPGVFLGSFALNFWGSLDLILAKGILLPFLVSTGLGLGASAQAYFSYYLRPAYMLMSLKFFFKDMFNG